MGVGGKQAVIFIETLSKHLETLDRRFFRHASEIMVGPVGFEPTTSGPKTLLFLGSPAPQVHRAQLRSGILLAESCSQTKLSRELL